MPVTRGYTVATYPARQSPFVRLDRALAEQLLHGHQLSVKEKLDINEKRMRVYEELEELNAAEAARKAGVAALGIRFIPPPPPPPGHLGGQALGLSAYGQAKAASTALCSAWGSVWHGALRDTEPQCTQCGPPPEGHSVVRWSCAPPWEGPVFSCGRGMGGAGVWGWVSHRHFGTSRGRGCVLPGACEGGPG